MSSFRNKLGDVATFTDVNKIVPEIYESSSLIQIFLFCGSASAYPEWGMDYCNKMMIFDHEDDLLERLWNYLQTKLQEQATLCLKRAEEYKQRALQYKRACG
ncbi:unnamed protein product [Rotaria sordida]|uniref:Uncharacterized protein n=1 Tax=Rotaria sordida TaxID=392033 RepID=A0A819KAJ8_9BILA|nr:unnamed protein product [Rotaria sordida]